MREHGGYRKNDPDTSKEAGEAMTGKKLTEIQQAVLSFYRVHHSATDEELQDALGDKYPGGSTLRSRRRELVDKGYLIYTAERRTNRGGMNMIVWALAPVKPAEPLVRKKWQKKALERVSKRGRK